MVGCSGEVWEVESMGGLGGGGKGRKGGRGREGWNGRKVKMAGWKRRRVGHGCRTIEPTTPQEHCKDRLIDRGYHIETNFHVHSFLK